MTFRLALAGQLPADTAVLEQLESILSQLREILPAGEDRLQILISPSYAASGWKAIAQKAGPICQILAAGDPGWEGICSRTVRAVTPLRGLPGEELCDCSDLLLMVWNEDVAEGEGATWELLQMAHHRDTPCIWISSKSKKVFWSESSYFEPFTPDCLRELGKRFCSEGMLPEDPEDRRIFLLPLGLALQKRFMRRYAVPGENTDTVQDVLMSGEAQLADIPGAEPLRLRLLEAFHRYDDVAIRMNERYRGVIYWRSVLPLITSAFLAIGFYAENVLGILPGTGPGFWVLVAGLGFLIHGLLNLYVYNLSQSETIRSWHKGYLNNRYLAEILRVLIHFAPYGIHLDLRKLCRGDWSMYMTVRGILEESDLQDRELGTREAEEILDHLEQMLQEQIAYHTRSQRRYSAIVAAMDRRYRNFFLLGFAAVVLRAVFQAVLAMWPITSGSLNGIPLQKFAGSFANMLALMLPGVASFFSTKLDLCNFRYSAEKHGYMVDRLTDSLDQIRTMRGCVDRIPLEALNTLGEELAQLMILEDTSQWYTKFRNARVKHL